MPSAWDLAFFVIIAAIVYSLVRPGSPAGSAAVAIGDLLEGLIGTATGYAFVASSKGGSS